MIHATEDFFSPTEGNFPPWRNFSDRFPIPTDGIFPPCRNFSDHIPIPKDGIYCPSFEKKLLQGGFEPLTRWL
jgi:hypothetical protein